MVNDVLGWLDYSAYAEVALLLFVIVFAGVSFAMAKMAPAWSGRCAAIPLSDESTGSVATSGEAASRLERLT